MAFRERFILKPTVVSNGDVLQYDANTESFVPSRASVESGAIIMWSLVNGAVPSGWAICDGTANAPGPDLRDQFITGLLFIQRMI